MQHVSMQVVIHTPQRLLFAGQAEHLYAVAENGSFGLLPNHSDFVTALQPSVLIVREPGPKELFFVVDEGLLVKQNEQVKIAVRRGLYGENLDSLNQALAQTFAELDEDERKARSAMSRLEASVVRRFAELGRPL